MKMTVEIDLQDIYFDEEGSLSDNIRAAIVYDIKQQVLAKFSQDIKERIAIEVQNTVTDVFNEMIKIEMNKILIEDQIPVKHGSTASLKDLIKARFETSSWSNPDEQIKKLAKIHGDEMKTRYDLMFATQIVANMSNHGLLKDEMSKLLLPQKEN